MYLPPRGRFRHWLAALFCAAAAGAHAQEFVTIDFPIEGKPLTAMGLSAPPRQVATPDCLGYVEVLLRPVHRAGHVFLTFVFVEDGGKGPAVFWSGDASGRQVTISANLGEGIVGLNRRTIALPDEIAKEAGRLYIMGRQENLLRLRIDWTEPTTTFVASDQESPSLIMGGALKLDRELTGQQQMTPPDAWFGGVLDAALQDGVAELSEDIELVVPLEGAVSEARLRAKFLGLPLGKSVRVWVNGKFAGRMQPQLPSLTDPGYIRHAGKRAVYAGWREGAIFIEPSALKEGQNSIVFESPGSGTYLSGAAMEIHAIDADAPQEDQNSPAAAASPLPKAVPAPSATPGP